MQKMKSTLIAACMCASALGIQTSAHASPTAQWASTATAENVYSENYAASAATGAPDSTGCDLGRGTQWATLNENDIASITLTYATAVVPTAINVYQNNVMNAISKIEVSADGTSWSTVYTGDTTKAVDGTCLAAKNYDDILTAKVSPSINFAVQQVRVTVDQTTRGWDEIDAVQLVSKTRQTIAHVASSLKKGKTLRLPAKTNHAFAVTWTTSTKAICSISSGVLKGLKKGTCKIVGSNAGNNSFVDVSSHRNVKIS